MTKYNVFYGFEELYKEISKEYEDTYQWYLGNKIFPISSNLIIFQLSEHVYSCDYEFIPFTYEQLMPYLENLMFLSLATHLEFNTGGKYSKITSTEELKAIKEIADYVWNSNHKCNVDAQIFDRPLDMRIIETCFKIQDYCSKMVTSFEKLTEGNWNSLEDKLGWFLTMVPNLDSIKEDNTPLILGTEADIEDCIDWSLKCTRIIERRLLINIGQERITKFHNLLCNWNELKEYNQTINKTA